MVNDMVNYASPQLNTVFGALSHPIRREILTILGRGIARVTEVAEPFNVSLPAISKHLRVLENANLIKRHKSGRTHYLELNATPLKEAAEWLAVYETFWQDQFDSLAKFLEDTPEDEQQ